MIRTSLRSGIVILLCIAGCQPAWNRVNRGQLKTDMRTLLERFECSGMFRSVFMHGTTRIGRIELRITWDELYPFIAGLGLKPLDTYTSLPITFQERIAEFMEAATSGESGDSALRVYGLFGRPESLRVSEQTSFEYLILAFNGREHIAHIEVEYAYG